MNSLEPGRKAPAFAAPNQHGKIIRLEDFRGRPLVLYFYPKDATPGCTLEACEFRDLHPELSRKATLLGVSPDAPDSHARFIARQGLPFDLLADTDHAIAETYGVWVEKSMYGKKYMGVERSTFVIGPDGILTAVFRKVKPAGHAAEVLGSLTSAGAGASAQKGRPSRSSTS